jgi:hypothetical protein
MFSQPRDKRAVVGIVGVRIIGWIGLAFTIAFMVVMMLAVPALRWFLVLSVPLGLLIAGILYVVNRRRGVYNASARGDSPDDLVVHPGIRIDKIPIRSWAGLVFAIGVMTMFLTALPPVRWFFLLTIPLGLAVGLILYLLHRH